MVAISCGVSGVRNMSVSEGVLPGMMPGVVTELGLEAGQPSKRGGWSRHVAADVVAAADLLAIAVAGVVPATLYPSAMMSVGEWQRTVQASLIAGILGVLCLKSADMLDHSRIHDFPRRPLRLATNLGIAVMAVMGIVVPASASVGDWWVWAGMWFGLAFVMLNVNHFAAHALFKRFTAAGFFDRRVAVFGAGLIARHIHDHIVGNRLGARFAGLYDDRKDQQRIDPMNLDVKGRLDDLVEAARKGRVDQVVIALPQLADARIAAIAQMFAGTQATVHIVTHIASDVVGKPRAHNVSNIGNVGLLDVRSNKSIGHWREMFALN